MGPHLRKLFLIAGACIVILILFFIGTRTSVLNRAVPECGDGICGVGECAEGCTDCKPGECDDGACQETIEDCRNVDCQCRPALTCAPEREDTDERGCSIVRCGDGFCDTPENSESCCLDCGCKSEFTCDRNKCYFMTPKLSFTPFMYTDDISVTSLAANPLLIKGEAHPFMALTLRNSVSDALNVNVEFSIENLVKREFDLGTMRSGMEQTITWWLKHEPELLTLEEDKETNLTVVVTYTDRQDVPHLNAWNFPLILRGRNTLDDHGHLVFFITPADVDIRTSTPRKIWREAQKLTLVEDEEGVQFPKETLARGSGSVEDIALVLASMYMNAGYKTSLVETDSGLLVRFWDERTYVILDPAKLSEDYSKAKTNTPGHAVWDIEKVWKEYNATVLSLED